MDTDRYVSPLSERYASKEMQYIFSPDMKFSTWRKLWIALAETEMELGLSQITPEMIEEMKAHVTDINYDWDLASLSGITDKGKDKFYASIEEDLINVGREYLEEHLNLENMPKL